MNRIRLLILGIALFIFEGSFAMVTGVESPKKQIDTAHFYMFHSYDVLKYRLNLDLYNCYQAPYSSGFFSTEVITFVVDSTLNSIKLNAVGSSLNIDSVGFSAVGFTHSNDTLKIKLDRIYHPGDLVNIKILYSHKNVRDHTVYSNDGFFFTDSPPEGARKWFPCWDRPSDKSLFDLTAKVPLNVRLGSNGNLADSLITGDTIYYHWVSRNPIATYLMTITSKVDYKINIAYWKKRTHPTDSITVRSYFQTGEHPDSLTGAIKSMANFFSRLFGEYPFEKIGFATLSKSFPWGGMENQTMINLTTNGWREVLISHEFSHQWFGDLITCGTWADIWLNESFATYCESLWIEYKWGNPSYKLQLEIRANNYLAGNPDFAIYNPSWAIHTPDGNLLYNTMIIYDKGACILHQLRFVLGDSTFFHVLKAYATDTNLMYKNAVTSDFIAKANKISKTDLNWFFNEWLLHPNHPVYSNSYSIRKSDRETWKLKLSLTQVQTNTIFYKMPVQVKVTFNDSTSTLLRIFNGRNHQLFDFQFEKQPIYIVFDPFRNILLKEATTKKVNNLSEIASNICLSENEPETLESSMTISYKVLKPSSIRISVEDSSGKLVIPTVYRTNDIGTYKYIADTKNFPKGTYFYSIESDNYNETGIMIKTK
ncbi:MAG: M1 family aminopeptidase [Bacteroidales bacterium]|jgi:aminopeptidase N